MAVPIHQARAIVGELRRRLTFAGLAGGRRRRLPTIPVGSVRREEKYVHDIDLLVLLPDGEPLKGILSSARLGGEGRLSIKAELAGGDRRRSFVVGGGPGGPRQVDLFLATEKEKPYALMHLTGSAEYNIRIRAHAKRQGLKLDQYGLSKGARPAPGSAAVRTERQLALLLGITPRAPADRSK